jgi:hypothetical protein
MENAVPYIITHADNIEDQNAFYKKCGKEGLIPVICTTRGGKADIQADVRALEAEYESLRISLERNDTPIVEIFEKVFESFQPKVRLRGFGYYSFISGVDKDVAQKMTETLAAKLDEFVFDRRRAL